MGATTMPRKRACVALALLSLCGAVQKVGSESSVAAGLGSDGGEVSNNENVGVNFAVPTRDTNAVAKPRRVRRLGLPMAPRPATAPADTSAVEMVVLRPVTVHDAPRVVASFRRWSRSVCLFT